jgi:rare lipoprotein A
MNRRIICSLLAVFTLTIATYFCCFSDNDWKSTKASWYHRGKKMTTAHRSLPKGSKVEVEHNGRRVVVTVDDRGPFTRGRDLDLSHHAFKQLALPSRGVINVRYRVLHSAAAQANGQKKK